MDFPAVTGALHCFASVTSAVANLWPPTHTEITTAIAAFLVGTVVGITGMGGGALMTPALIFLGVGRVSSIVTADLTAAAIYKTSGACVHWREGSPNLRLAAWLTFGSVPMALLGPHLIHWMNPARGVDTFLAGCIGAAALLAAATYALRIYTELRRRARGLRRPQGKCVVRPLPTILIGALGGLLVGITSVGSGSIIMIALLMLYPGLPAVQLVGTDLVQAVPLVLSGAISNISVNGLNWSIAIPLIIGSLPGCMLGSKIAPRMRGKYIRRGIVVVLTISGLALMDKAGWVSLGATDGETHPKTIALLGLIMLLLAPFLRAVLQRRIGLAAVKRQAVELGDESGRRA
jgi:uncharacterized membrane protein YfcA